MILQMDYVTPRPTSFDAFCDGQPSRTDGRAVPPRDYVSPNLSNITTCPSVEWLQGNREHKNEHKVR